MAHDTLPLWYHLAAFLGTDLPYNERIFHMHANPKPAIQRIAHRGGSALAPENTLAAFRHALTLPIDAIELDVQMSHDGHLIVFHDETVERLTNGQGNILDLDLAYLRSLNAAANFPGGWPQPQQIPTLSEVLTLARQAHKEVALEIKLACRDGVSERYPGIAEAVAEDILAAGMQAQVMIMSFDWQILPRLKVLIPGVQTGALVSRELWDSRAETALPALVAQVRALQCEWVHLDNRLFFLDLLDFVHASALKLGIWTVNDPARLQELARAGVDALTTDRPDLFFSDQASGTFGEPAK
jgi:glycerophosphoryl diester phosphodiesterase